MSIYGKVVDILLAVCIMLLFPVLYYQKKNELLFYEILQERAEELVHQATSNGKLSKDMWEQFMMETSKYDQLILLEFFYTEYRFEPIYLAGEPETFTGEVMEYEYEADDYEIKQILNTNGTFQMRPDGYLRLSITIIDDHNTIFFGGHIRADLSFVNPICHYCCYFCDDAGYIL